MTQIAFILLCHKDPEGVIAQTLRLTAAGDCVAIHFDARAKQADFARIREALAANPQVTFSRRRIKCGWGEWSLVAATLEGLRAAVAEFPGATHFYMLSGDCMPIKTAEYIRGRLEQEDVDYIESFDFFGSDWIKTGIKEERLIYRHWFNERQRKWLFYTSMDLQKKFNLARKVPEDLGNPYRQPMVVPAPPHGRGRAGIRGKAPGRHPLFRDDLDPGRDLLPDPCGASGAGSRNPLAHADLPDVHRLRHAGDVLR